jgi:hypothetical protein
LYPALALARARASIATAQTGAIEFYAGGASLPVQFNRTSSGCGALLLWTRDR